MWKIWTNWLLPNGSKSCPKCKKIAQSGHTDCYNRWNKMPTGWMISKTSLHLTIFNCIASMVTTIRGLSTCPRQNRSLISWITLSVQQQVPFCSWRQQVSLRRLPEGPDPRSSSWTAARLHPSQRWDNSQSWRGWECTARWQVSFCWNNTVCLKFKN